MRQCVAGFREDWMGLGVRSSTEFSRQQSFKEAIYARHTVGY
jgi:hypothetical protein